MDDAIFVFLYVTYVGVTLLLGTANGDQLLYWIDPRTWILIPIVGGVLASGPMLAIFALLMVAQRVGLLAEDSIAAGSLVIWTAAMIGLRIASYLQERRERRRSPVRRPRSRHREPRTAVAGLSDWRLRDDVDAAFDSGAWSGGPAATASAGSDPRPGD